MEKTSQELYLELMQVVRNRFDFIDAIRNIGTDDYGKSEIAAFHGRKIIEAIAFGCLISTNNGLNFIPRDAKGQYNAETILVALNKKDIDTFPSPSFIRKATEEEVNQLNVTAVIEGIPERRISREELIKKYQRFHVWLHELNPFTKAGHEEFYKNNHAQLWKDLEEIKLFIMAHFISIKGEGIYCVLKDKIDGHTKVGSLSKASDSF